MLYNITQLTSEMHVQRHLSCYLAAKGAEIRPVKICNIHMGLGCISHKSTERV